MTPNPSQALPSPDQRPDADVVIYDGSCRLCRASAQALSRIDLRDQLAFLPLQDPVVTQRYPDLSQKELEQHVYVVDHHGGRHNGATAVRYLTGQLPALWPLAPLLHLPGSQPVWEWLYEQVSRRRHIFDR